MICKCGETGVLNEVLNKHFYYCRSCKVEIFLEIKVSNEDPSTIDWSPIDWDELSDVMYGIQPLDTP